jgi:hypothetical protein
MRPVLRRATLAMFTRASNTPRGIAFDRRKLLSMGRGREGCVDLGHEGFGYVRLVRAGLPLS